MGRSIAPGRTHRSSRRRLLRELGGASLTLGALALLGGCKQAATAEKPTAPARAAASPTPLPVAGPRIGLLWLGRDGASPFADAFHQGLREVGLVIGQNANLE